MKKEVISLFFLVIITIASVSASFEVGNLSHTIDKQYGPSQYVSGWINISLNNEPANSVFKDSLENSATLIDLLNTGANQDFEYSCSTTNCVSDYSSINGEKSKTFDLDNKESKIMGFKFTGNIVSINSINFTIQSNALSSCYNQLEIDFFNDGRIEIGNNKGLEYSTACSFLKSYGCFNSNEIMTLGNINPTPYCQRIRLSKSPGFKLGAWVKDSKNLTMSLYNINGNSIEGANCELPESLSEGEVSCYISYSVPESKDYYVCIYSDDWAGESKIRGYSDLEVCGFQGTPSGSNSENTAYQIFAEGVKFKAVETLEITNSLPYGNTLSSEVNDYIWEKYGSFDCSTNECIIPIKFISGKNQTLIIKNLSIKYDLVGFGGAEENNFYELTEIPATLNSDFQKLYLDEGNFSVPSDFGEHTFSLSLNDKEIFSEEIIIESVPAIQNLNPTTTASAFPTLFEIIVDSSDDIIKYKWDFGNGDTKITTVNKITYTYNSTGQYELKVSVTDSNQRSSYKIFNLLVNTPKELINKTLKKKLMDLTNVNTQIKEFESFYQESLNSILDFEELESKLINIQKESKIASSESEYNKIMVDLLELKIPESVVISKSADSISFYADKNNIDLDILQIIGGGNYNASNEDKYLDAILAWNQKNIETKINFKELVARYEYFDEPVLKVFELQISEEGLDDDFYLVLHKLDDIKFKENYEEKEESGYVYINLAKTKKTIVFSTTEDIYFNDLPVFISPELNKLVIIESSFDEDMEETSRWTLFLLIISLLIIFGIITYLVLQEWYKKKYESHLFKNKNSPYNLITYIENVKKRGLKDKDIIIKLKKSGWNSEQINYIMKKYSGKRTGMFEIPVGKILGKFKNKKVQEKRIGRNFPSRFNQTAKKRFENR